MTDQLAVSFDRDRKGKVVGLRLHEGGQEFDVPREGVVVAPEIPLAELQKYVGRYAGGPLELTVFIQNQRLAVRLPNNASLDLRPPEPGGRRAARANAAIALAFEESPAGAVTAVNFHRPNLPVMRLTPASPLPTVAEIMKLRRLPASSTSTMRTTGRVRFAQSGVEGRFVSASAGGDRSRLEIDLGRFGQTQVVLNNGRGWRAATGDSIQELPQKELKQVRLAEVVFGDWRKSYDALRVIRAGQFEGRKVYGVQLESAGLPPTFVAVDAETGDVLQVLRRMVVGGAGALETTTTYSDYRDVGGMRVPHRYVETTEQIGRTIFEVERVEVGVKLPADTFTLKPSGRGR
jgi:hypothetical protein